MKKYLKEENDDKCVGCYVRARTGKMLRRGNTEQKIDMQDISSEHLDACVTLK